MQELPIEPESVVPAIVALLVAFVLSLPIAWNREQGRRRMGLRTFPFVAMASCAYVLIGVLAIAIAAMTFLVFLVLTPVREKMDNGA